MSEGSFICEACGERAAEAGDCDACERGPLLDLNNPSVVEVLRLADQQRGDKRKQQHTLLAIPIGVAAGIALGSVLPVMLPIPFGRIIQIVLLMVLVAYLALLLLGRLFPAKPRFAFIDGGPSPSIRKELSGHGGGWRKPVIALGLLCAVGFGVGGFSVYSKHRAAQQLLERREAAGQAWSDLQQCVLGEALLPGETVVQRVRLIVLSRPAKAPATDWPGRCSEHVTTLYQALDERELGPSLRQELVERFGCDAQCVVDAPGEQLAALADVVASVGLPSKEATVEAPAKLTGRLLAKADFATLSSKDIQIRERLPRADGSATMLISSRRDGIQLCDIKPQDPAAFHCLSVPNRMLSATAQLAGNERELLVSGKAHSGAKRAYLDRQANPVDTVRGIRNGFVMRQKDDDLALAYVVDGEVKHKKRVKDAEERRGSMIVGDAHLMWFERSSNDTPTLYVQPLEETEDLLGEKTKLGTADPALGKPELCRSGDTQVALFGGRRSPKLVTFYNGSRWTPLTDIKFNDAPTPSAVDAARARRLAREKQQRTDVHAGRQQALRDAAEFGMLGLLNSGAGGDPAPLASPTRAPSDTWLGAFDDDELRRLQQRRRRRGVTQPHRPSHSFTCSERAAFLTWYDTHDDSVHQLRCEPTGCKHQHSKLSGAQVKSWWTAATLVDAEAGVERVVVVWQAERDEIRLRNSSMAELAGAPDQLVMDGHEHGGPSTVDLEVFASRDAVVALFRGLGLHGLRFAPSGRFAALAP